MRLKRAIPTRDGTSLIGEKEVNAHRMPSVAEIHVAMETRFADVHSAVKKTFTRVRREQDWMRSAVDSNPGDVSNLRGHETGIDH